MLYPLKSILYSFLGAIFISLFAQLSFDVPWSATTIPISGQTFAVLVTGMLLGKYWGPLAILIYLLAGGLGLPIFADGGFGWETFTKGSAGFLYGFFVAAFLVGLLAEKGWGLGLPKSLIVMLLGTIVIMGFGVVYLTYLYDFPRALEYGFYPFVPGAIVKIILGAVVVYLIERRKGAVVK